MCGTWSISHSGWGSGTISGSGSVSGGENLWIWCTSFTVRGESVRKMWYEGLEVVSLPPQHSQSPYMLLVCTHTVPWHVFEDSPACAHVPHSVRVYTPAFLERWHKIKIGTSRSTLWIRTRTSLTTSLTRLTSLTWSEEASDLLPKGPATRYCSGRLRSSSYLLLQLQWNCCKHAYQHNKSLRNKRSKCKFAFQFKE